MTASAASVPVLAFDSSTVVSWLTQQVGAWQTVDKLIKSNVPIKLPGPVLAEIITVSHKLGNVSTGAQIQQNLALQGMEISYQEDPPNTPPGTLLIRAAEILEASYSNPRIKPNGQASSLSHADGTILAMCEYNGWQAITRDKGWLYAQQYGQTTATVHVF